MHISDYMTKKRKMKEKMVLQIFCNVFIEFYVYILA